MTKTMDDYWSGKHIRLSEVNPFAKEVSSFLKRGDVVLDLGSGRGMDACYFAELGCTVTALDIASENVLHLQDAARQKDLSVTALQGDLSQPLSFADKTFDAVYAHLSIHYFDNDTTKRIIAEVERVLKPGGLFFVKCKSVDDPLYGKGEKVGEDMYRDDHTRHFFSKTYMASLLTEWDVLSLRDTSSVYMDYQSAFIEAIARH